MTHFELLQLVTITLIGLAFLLPAFTDFTHREDDKND